MEFTTQANIRFLSATSTSSPNSSSNTTGTTEEKQPISGITTTLSSSTPQTSDAFNEREQGANDDAIRKIVNDIFPKYLKSSNSELVNRQLTNVLFCHLKTRLNELLRDGKSLEFALEAVTKEIKLL